MSEWNSKTLGELLGEKGYIRGPFGSALKRGEMKDSGVPVYEQLHAIYNSRKFRFFIDEKKFKELERFQVKSSDLIISCSGTVGKISIIDKEDPKGIISQALLILRPEVEKVNPLYLKYFLTSEIGQYHLLSASHGSVQPNIAERKIVQQIPIDLPSVNEQDKIIEVLSSLDYKIDLLQRQNKTLEEMAETLFRQLFVEGSEQDAEEVPLSSISKQIKKSISPSKTPEQSFNHFSLPAYDNGKKPEVQLGRDILSNKYKIDKGQILISKLNPRTPRVWFINSCDENSICSTEFQVYEPLNKEYREFIYCFLRTKDTRDLLAGASSGTSGSHQRVNPEDINSLTFKIPNFELLQKFHVIVSEWVKKIDSNVIQIHKLENLRDTILPKLMSGEVRVN